MYLSSSYLPIGSVADALGVTVANLLAGIQRKNPLGEPL